MDKWNNFKEYFFRSDKLGISIDFSQMGLSEAFFSKMSEKTAKAYREMAALEAGAIANTDENRMVGHYWLRNPSIAPSPEIQSDIGNCIGKILKFAEKIHLGHITGQDGKFENALFIGIGGSILGPQLICESLEGNDKVKCHFIDNTDPDGIDLVLSKLAGKLGKTLVIVTSKSGSTPEPRNAMLEVSAAYEKSGYSFPRHAVAITGENSLLDRQAVSDGWIERFPMWDWVGGRTSVFSAVGLLPAALQGNSTETFTAGARDMDMITRIPSPKNPAMLMALSWYIATGGIGENDMVVIPYKDRLKSFAKYLQQIVMESLGKEKDRQGNIVRQGLSVYGNKGSTDQHSFVQQLRDGIQNFFLTVISVLEARNGTSICVDSDGMTSGDYLNGFAFGSMRALAENGTNIIHISIDKFSPYELGVLIALYERAVGFYASLINVNAYNQPGVEAGKKAAKEILAMQRAIVSFLSQKRGKQFTAADISDGINCQDRVLVFKILEHISANDERVKKNQRDDIFNSTYGVD
ncbi:MAG: glucose-6-phosphate isomerase [Puniceicoccales bacterium]|jgi:glucose-6-phosphate isomerase|nr:glucose-6-phosphate isomerase [Puniceicoccales bacterium]